MTEDLSFARVTAIYRHEKDHRTLAPLEEDFYERLDAHLATLRTALTEEGRSGTSARAGMLGDEIGKTERKRLQILTERERKIALLASQRASGTEVEMPGLPKGERELFDRLVELLQESRARALGQAAQRPLATPSQTAREAMPLPPPATPPPRTLADSAIVRVLQDLPPFAGLRGTYRLHKGDVVTLQTAVAAALIAKGKVVEMAGALPSKPNR
jgi:DNA replication initiation complex subunit (GINS family)